MPINYPGVPIATGLLPANVNELIAKGPDVSWIGNLPTQYFQGLDAGYQQRNRDLFQQGLPRDSNGNIDWGAVSEQLVKAGGAGGVQSAVNLQNYELARDALRGIGAEPGFGAPPQAAIPPSTAGGARPMTPPAASAATPSQAAMPAQGAMPSTTDQTLTPAQIANANPAGIPQAVAQPTPQTFATRFAPAVQPSVLPTSPAATPAAAPQQPGGVQVAQATTTPAADENARQAQYYQTVADRLFRQAEALAIANPAMAKVAQSRAEAAAKIADQYRGASIGTPEMQTARAAGIPNPLTYQGAQEVQKGQIARSDKLYAGIAAAASQYERDLAPYNTVARSVLNDPRAYTGIGADAVLDINKLRAIWNGTGRSAAQLQEMLEKVRASSVLSQINTQKDQMQEAGGTSSRIFSAQVDQVAKASPGLENTLAGNRALINIQTKMGELQSEVARQARVYRAQHGYLDDGFDQQIADYLKRNPVFTKQEQSHPDWLGAPNAPRGLTPAEYVQWGAKMGLKPGDVVNADGQYMKIPSPTVNQVR